MSGPIKKERKLSIQQQIVIRLVTNMKGCKIPAIWGREMKICNRLIAKYGKDFLLVVPPPEGYKVDSLLFFTVNLGENYLSDQLLEFKKNQESSLPKKEEIPLASGKIGEDIIIINKLRTLKDFLNYGQTNKLSKRKDDGRHLQESISVPA